jgi:hypothetical protein
MQRPDTLKRQNFMLPEEFESPISKSERQQTYILDRSAVGIDLLLPSLHARCIRNMFCVDKRTSKQP